MITLFASLAGFISSLIPEILKYFLDKNDKKHELELLSYQMRLQKSVNGSRLEEIIATGNMEEIRSLYKTYKTGISWVDALNGSVRPVLAYSFFGLYTFIKFLQYKVIAKSLNISDIVNVLWNIDDQAVFAGIISFYFGQRAVSKLRGK
jgi:hypothetical protein